jgi:hypothetical protein
LSLFFFVTSKKRTPNPSLFAIIVEHPEDSVLFHALPYMFPIHEQYLGMLDVDVVIRMLRQTNAENAEVAMNVAIDWYNCLGETQAFDNHSERNCRMFVLIRGGWCGPGILCPFFITFTLLWIRQVHPSRKRLIDWHCFSHPRLRVHSLSYDVVHRTRTHKQTTPAHFLSQMNNRVLIRQIYCVLSRIQEGTIFYLTLIHNFPRLSHRRVCLGMVCCPSLVI